DARFEFSGGLLSVLGIRCAGQVHTSSDFTNSWVAFGTEVEAYPAATLSTPAPTLRIENVSNAIAVSWPGWADVYLLEASTNRGQPNAWETVTNQPGGDGGDWRVTLMPGAQSRFFRLRLP